MGSRLLPALGSCVAALAVGTAGGGAAGAASSEAAPASWVQHPITTKAGPAKSHGNCYSSLKRDIGVAVNSQVYRDEPQYSSAAADNFSVQQTCVVKDVYVPGVYYAGVGPADSETVTFYHDEGGQPGAVVASRTVVGTDHKGTFTIPLKHVTLAPGSYWVSVQANMDLDTGGRWGWELTEHQKQGIDGQFENGGGGYGVCPTWEDVWTCTGFGSDFMLRVDR